MEVLADQMQEILGALQDIKVKQIEYEKNFEGFDCPSKQAIDLQCNESFNDDNNKLETSRPNQLSQLNALRNSITFIEKKVASLKRSMQYLETKLDDLEQYSRSNCLVAHGTGISSSNNYSVFVNNVVDKLNTALQMTEKLSPNDVDIAHFLPSAGKKNNKESPPKKTIIIKFVRRSIRNDVFFSKRKLAGTGMMITESLTKRRMQLLKEAQQEFGVENTWTVKGNVNVSIKKKKHLIKCS